MFSKLWLYTWNGSLLVLDRILVRVLRHTKTWQSEVKGAEQTWTWGGYYEKVF